MGDARGQARKELCGAGSERAGRQTPPKTLNIDDESSRYDGAVSSPKRRDFMLALEAICYARISNLRRCTVAWISLALGAVIL